MERPSDTQWDTKTLLARLEAREAELDECSRQRARMAMGLIDAEHALDRLRMALVTIREGFDGA